MDPIMAHKFKANDTIKCWLRTIKTDLGDFLPAHVRHHQSPIKFLLTRASTCSMQLCSRARHGTDCYRMSGPWNSETNQKWKLRFWKGGSNFTRVLWSAIDSYLPLSNPNKSLSHQIREKETHPPDLQGFCHMAPTAFCGGHGATPGQ